MKQNLHTYEERRDYFRERVAKALVVTVSLVGAGPGDPELITVRGLARVRACEVLVYDRLVAQEIVAEAPIGSLRISRDGSTQDDINELLVAHGRRGRRVVRLKGGDPFVFGRGGEEALALVARRRAVRARARRLVDRRRARVGGDPGHAPRRLAGGDGVRRERRRGARRRGLARVPGTLVAFMGGAVVGRLAERLIAEGKPASTPAAVVSRGTTEDEQVIVAPLGAIGAAAADAPDAGARRDRRGRCGSRSARRFATIRRVTDFRRVDALPPYAFAEVERLKLELRRAGEDVIDLGFGNPDVPPPEIAVEKLREAALLPRNHRYSSSRGPAEAARGDLRALPRPVRRRARSRDRGDDDARREGGARAPALGAARPGRRRARAEPELPDPSLRAGLRRGRGRSACRSGRASTSSAGIEEAWLASQPRPRVLLCSFPHNPTTACASLDELQRLVDFAREREIVLVHDFAYADLAYDGYRPPSIFECEGAREVAVEHYSLTKGFSLAGWRVAFLLGRADVVGALARLKSYLDYGSFQPLQIAATIALREARERPAEVAEIYGGRRNALCDGLDAHRLGRSAAAGDDVRLGADPERASPRRSSRCGCCARRTSRSAPAAASARTARGTCGSRSSRTSSGSRRRCAAFDARSADMSFRVIKRSGRRCRPSGACRRTGAPR